MIWIKKTFPRFGVGWANDQTRFADLQLGVAADGTDAYRQMLMGSVRKDDDRENEDIFLRLGDACASFFPGYARGEAPPPMVTSLLVGDQTEFDRSFSVPKLDDGQR